MDNPLSNALDRVKNLTRVLEDRNAEIEKLRRVNEELLGELRSAQSDVSTLTHRVVSVEESHKQVLAQLQYIIDNDLKSRNEEILHVTQLNEKLNRRVADLTDHVEEVSWHSKGLYAYLGLQVIEDHQGVRILKLRDPASTAGLMPGDVLKRMRMEKEYAVVTIEKFQRCITELLPDSDVHITVLRDGRELKEFVLKPVVASDRPKH
eukprot:PhF_6_TR10719/c0_g1_i1/m.17277